MSSTVMTPIQKRYFHTIHSLRHENPLVRLTIVSAACRARHLLNNVPGPPTDWLHPPDAARPARASQDQERCQGHRSILREGRCWKEHHRSKPSAVFRAAGAQIWYLGHGHLWPVHPHAVQLERGAEAITKYARPLVHMLCCVVAADVLKITSSCRCRIMVSRPCPWATWLGKRHPWCGAG